jgi:magnesium transporter
MIKIFYKNIREKNLKELEAFRIGSWIYVEKPSERDLNFLSQNYGLDLDLLKDATDFYEVPRMEVDNKKVYIYAQYPFLEDNNLLTAPVLFVINENFILTLSSKQLPFIKKFFNNEIEFNTTQKTKFLLQLLLQINVEYNKNLININKKLRSISVKLEDISNKDIVSFVGYEAVLNEFLSDLVPMNSVLNKILSGKYLKLFEEDKDLVEDLLLSNNQFIENARGNMKSIVNIREAYSTIMTNNLNRVIKLFTSLTVLLTIPTMVASIYGMNVKLPIDDSPFAFTVIISIIVLISVFLLYIFWKRKWL